MLLTQLMFLAGVTMVIGPQKAFTFFFQSRKWKGTATFFGGILLVLLKWPIIGMCVEAFGFVNLFGYVLCWHAAAKVSRRSRPSDFFPTVIRFLKALPIVGRIFEIPVIRQVRPPWHAFLSARSLTCRRAAGRPVYWRQASCIVESAAFPCPLAASGSVIAKTVCAWFGVPFILHSVYLCMR